MQTTTTKSHWQRLNRNQIVETAGKFLSLQDIISRSQFFVSQNHVQPQYPTHAKRVTGHSFAPLKSVLAPNL